MNTTMGSDSLRYEPVENWEKLPAGWSFIDVAGAAVDSRDNVYVFSRGEHPLTVFDRDGNLLRSWGEGHFSQRTHGIHITADDSLFCIDDGRHVVEKFTLEGKLLLTLGTPDKPAPSGAAPFNRPTHAAISPLNGDLYVTDGYGNCRVHRFDASGKHLHSWGEGGIDPGQFDLPHNIVIDGAGLLYIADRENSRIQVFDADGKFVTMWNNIHRPDGLALDTEGNLFVGELNGLPTTDGCPGLGHRVSIYNLQGQLQTRLGDAEEGEGPTQFIAPHCVAVDSEGSLYVGDVAYTIRGRHLNPPRELKCFRKFRRVR